MKVNESSNSCRLCSIVNGNFAFGIADKPIFETENFIVIPSIGAFIEGWTMIVPKKHVYDMSSFYSNAEFNNLAKRVLSHVERHYGHSIMFEHGAACSGSLTGCGVDHAHYHFVPTTQSLYPILQKGNLAWEQCCANEIQSKTESRDYLFYSETISLDAGACGYLHIIEKPVSQYFRKLLATVTGHEHVSDYKTNPFVDRAERTAQSLARTA